MAKRKRPRTEVFLNIPYDKKFERLFLAYIAGISAFGLIPRATLEITDSSRRLNKIIKLISACEYSIHDLSRVQLDRKKPRTPRFNMPFELGLCVAEAMRTERGKQNWFVFEAMEQRMEKSLSDLKGTDAKIHEGRISGVFAELCNIFKPRGRRPTVQQMSKIYREVRGKQSVILRESGANTIFKGRVFKDICAVASAWADEIVV
ncbi:MAG TPA: hypothetical protein VJN89_19760 [Candidatus Acidoferrum sp.]|nr:hypothetical protein [Candidatus Acidoferrum sp.]